MSKVNLIYATDGLGFFTKVNMIRGIIDKYKKDSAIAKFTEADEFEISRGASYAVFPELLTGVKEGHSVNLNAFRKSLTDRQITDIAFQNKILNLTLQNKSGVQYAMGKIVDGLFIDNELLIMMNHNYKLELEVDSNNSVNLIFKGVWEDVKEEPRQPAFEATVKINITPEKATITNFDLTKLSDTPETSTAYDLLIENQQNILMKLITFIKQILGFNSEFTLEKKDENDANWAPGEPK